MPKMNQREIEWQTQEDARVLARYQDIMTDSKRKNRAIKEARRQADDLTARANAMSRAASIKKLN